MIGERIQKARGNITQERAAKGMGISRARLGHYENGRSEPDNETLAKIADYLEVTTDYLLGRTNVPKPPEEEYDPLEELRQFMIDNGLENESVNFYDIEEWKKLSPEDVQDIINHYKYKLWEASRRKEKKKDD